jgi:competence protein ComEC
VLGCLLLVARWAGLRARLLPVCGLLGVVGFVLIARPEPSVVRAAAMGTVALLGMGGGGRRSGVRALGAAAFLLLLLDPWLATSPGFALSVLATAGILLVAPGFRDSLATWAPRWAAEAVAVPVAAQLACTPLVAVLSGEVSLVAVAANLVVAPLVGPATVLGLAGGLLALVVPWAGALLGAVACWCAHLVITVAHVAAGLPGAAAGWPTTPAGITVLTLACLLGSLGASLFRSRALVLLAATGLGVALLRPLPTPGWPPQGWVTVMCDVGQGDAVVLATGPGEAVVVDAGPDPALVDACLDRLGVDRVPVLVLTHFHADHVDGLAGVLAGRAVGEVQVSPLPEPGAGAAAVRALAAAAGVPVRVPAYGEVGTAGRLTWRVVAPRRVSSENPNDASLVLEVEAAGLRLLLAGDVEPESQAPLLREHLAPVDVLKVPHHGSRHQAPRLLTGLGARVALISVGADNDYGHPAPSTMRALEYSGAVVRRTDEDGDVAVLVHDGELRLATRR